MLQTQLLVTVLLSIQTHCIFGKFSFFRPTFRSDNSFVPPVVDVDPGNPLFLTPYLESGQIEKARELSLVGPLGGPVVKSYSGYLTVNKTCNSNLFFWFFPAQTKPEHAPVLLWLQGGPGGSSMFGLFVEHGPYVVTENKTLEARKFSWTSKYSMLYIDNPVGTGFSFTDKADGYARNEDDVGKDLYSALIQFFRYSMTIRRMISMLQRVMYVRVGEMWTSHAGTGIMMTSAGLQVAYPSDSYAGKYVPAIGHYIHINNPTAKVKINFKGVAIGDGLCDPEVMLGGYAEFMYQIGIVDQSQKRYIQQQTDIAIRYIQKKKWVEAFDVFDAMLNGDQIEYPSFFENVTGCSNYYNFLQCTEPVDQDYFTVFLSRPEVRKSIHVGNLTFHNGSEVEQHLMEDIMQSVKPWVTVLMDNYRVLIYSGQLDIIVAAPLTERFLLTVPWSKAEEYKKADRHFWFVNPSDKEVAGYVRKVGEFYQVIIRNGGHILPYDQPERAFDMIDRFISRKGFSL